MEKLARGSEIRATPSQFAATVRCPASSSRLRAVATSGGSSPTPAIPRPRNCLNPRATLIWPNTGSTVCLRRGHGLSQHPVRSFVRSSATCPVFAIPASRQSASACTNRGRSAAPCRLRNTAIVLCPGRSSASAAIDDSDSLLAEGGNGKSWGARDGGCGPPWGVEWAEGCGC